MKRPAYAKINLSLRVLGRREDGFHEIDTFMVPISLADEVRVELVADGSGIAITCSDPAVPADASNLAVVAANRFLEASGKRAAVRIHLEKRIPAGAGLGGGSSDAVAVLLCLNELLGTNLKVDDLERLAARTGSDAPFFVRGVPARCTGRGEIVEPVHFQTKLDLVLLRPSFGVETPWAYQAWAHVASSPLRSEVSKVGGLELVNDLERPVFQKHLLLPVLRQWMADQPGSLAARMSGSGSTLFAIAENAGAARCIEESVRRLFGPALWVCSAETFTSPRVASLKTDTLE